jgi:3-oxoacyl-ACP reductase-like protein
MAKSDGLAEVLVALAANSATLIERARASGLFKQAETVDATVTPAPASAPAADASIKALQDIIVSQAMKIHALEAEILRLSGAV